MPLPADLARAAVDGGGRVAFVLGAGCSFEPPTGLPLAHQMAWDLHGRLVNEGVLTVGQCADPRNLEAVVDAVFAIGGTKTDVVSRLPRQELRLARPNAGHRVLAALMYEGAVGNALTINFDLAVEHALAESGARRVSIIAARQDHRDFGSAAMIYLHGCANSPDGDWVLTSAEVEQGWDDGWKDVVSQRVAASPVVVVVGMGTMVGVLLRSLKLIIESLPENAQIYCVGPGDFEASGVAEALDLDANQYIQLGWCEFAEKLAQPVWGHQMTALRQACAALCALGSKPDQLDDLLNTLAGAGLIEGGRVRSRWLLGDGDYFPWSAVEPRWMAELTTALAFAADSVGAVVQVEEGGRFKLRGGEVEESEIACIHGRARLRWPELELDLELRRKSGMVDYSQFDLVLVAGVEGPRPFEMAPPPDLMGRTETDDIVDPVRRIRFYLATDAEDLARTREALL